MCLVMLAVSDVVEGSADPDCVFMSCRQMMKKEVRLDGWMD